VKDLMPEFWRVWDSGAKDRVKRIRREFVDNHIGLYKPALGEDHLTDKQISNLVAVITQKEDSIRRITRELPPIVCTEIKRMPQFGKFETKDRIYIWPSLLTSDGTMHFVDGTFRLFLGPDVIGYARPEVTNHAPFVDHELFHLLHSQNNAQADRILRMDVPPVYQSLWIEGAATFFSAYLNPKAPMSDILSSSTLETEASSQLPLLARQLAERFDSTKEEDLKEYFWYRTKPDKVPVRAAYYVGYIIAKNVFAKTGKNWQKMILLSDPEMKMLVKQTLLELQEQP
jgi:hypothetical protein